MTQRLFALCVAFLFLSSPLAIAQSNRQPMTNSDVVRMVQKGLSEEAIISAIYSVWTNFDLSPNGLANLRAQKVSERIIDAMISRQGNKLYVAPRIQPPPNGTLSFYGSAAWSFGLPAVRAYVNYTDTQGDYYFAESPQKTRLAVPSFGVAFTLRRLLVPFAEFALFETGNATAYGGAASVDVRSTTASGNLGLGFAACQSRWCGQMKAGGGMIFQELRSRFVRPGLPPDTPVVNSRVGDFLFGTELQYYAGSHWGAFLSADGFVLTKQLTNGTQFFSCIGLGLFYQTKSSMR